MLDEIIGSAEKGTIYGLKIRFKRKNDIAVLVMARSIFQKIRVKTFLKTQSPLIYKVIITMQKLKQLGVFGSQSVYRRNDPEPKNLYSRSQ